MALTVAQERVSWPLSWNLKADGSSPVDLTLDLSLIAHS